jgi:hypothetical protein
MVPVLVLFLALLMNQAFILALAGEVRQSGAAAPNQLNGIYLEAPDSGRAKEESEVQSLESEQLPLETFRPESSKEVSASDSALKASAAFSTDSGKGRLLLKGQVNLTVPEGTPIKLKLATVPSHRISLLNRDMEGNLYPAKIGQEITARTSEDLYVDENKVIPEGTLFHGQVSKILPPRRVGRPGSLVLSFDSLTTPDGRKFAFKAQADNIKPSTLRTKAQGFGIIAANAAGGAIVGALVAYELFGLQYTISMHGYNIAAVAGGGALVASGYAIMRRGPEATLEPGDDLNMKINSDLLMPVAVEPKDKKPLETIPGLVIKLSNGRLIKDGLEGSIYTVDATINNDSDRSFRSIDLFLQDTNGNLCPLQTIPEDESESLFTIEPNSIEHRQLSFSVSYPKLKKQLVLLEHNSRQICYRQPLP